MQTKEKLLSQLSEISVDCYETMSDITTESIELMSFEEFYRFIKKHQIDTVFYSFAYASPEDFLIKRSLLQNFDPEIVEIMQDDFKKYNQKIRDLDFNRPVVLTIFCLYQGHTIYAAECDDWVQELGYGDPEQAVYSITQEKEDELKNEKEEVYIKREEARKQLRKRILNDPNFYTCTNKDLRRIYTRDLVKTDKSIEALFYSPLCGLYDIGINTFVEDVWREHKASL